MKSQKWSLFTTLNQAVQAARPNVISPLTNDSSTAATTVTTPQANYPQIITSILSGQTTNRQGDFTESGSRLGTIVPKIFSRNNNA